MYFLSTADIEKQIAHYALNFDSIKDDEVEWRFQPPAFIPSFVASIENLRRIPSQSEYTEFYFKQNREALQFALKEKWRETSLRNQKTRALVARLKRAYPSFVRDIYFLALLRENGINTDYDPTQDVEGGVDLIVSDEDKKIQIHVFLESTRSVEGRRKKDKRHDFSGQHIDVRLVPDECKRVGKFWLPTLRHVEMIRNQLNAAK